MVFGNPEHLFFYCLVVSLSNGRGSKGEGQIEKMKNPLLKLYLFANGSKYRKVGRRCYADNQTIRWFAS